jgi:parallel beta-helix repeat protein
VSGVVIAPGDNSADAQGGAWTGNNTVYYFEPGLHSLPGAAWTGDSSAYVGGYTPSAGAAILDGAGKNGGFASNPGVKNANETWEYLTIRNFGSSRDGAVLGLQSGAAFVSGNTYKYDTIGPNEYSDTGASGQSSGGGYAIGLSGTTTIQYDCLTRNAQGAYNGDGLNDVIDHNEISWNGLGEYPDTGGPGASPFACGCSGGGKLFFTVNAQVTDNWVHDNYNSGIWLDFDNTGATVTGNYVASNWADGIAYEASYNASISGNILTGNGWASDGSWPAGTNGQPCFGGVSCTNGNGPIDGAGGGLPYAAITLNNSGGNASLSTVALPGGGSVTSRYSGQLLVQGNSLINNFGGTSIYTDTDRYPGNGDNDSACSVPLGALAQANSAVYYQQPQELQAQSASITGAAVSAPGAGTRILCDDYGAAPASEGSGGGQSVQTQAPEPGMAVFDVNAGTFLGNVASVSSASSFTLDRSPGNRAGARLLLSAYGGCGMADYSGSAPGRASGSPPGNYWDNCIWGARNITISGNTFSTDAHTVSGCTVVNMCGFNMDIAFNAGVPQLMQVFDQYSSLTQLASGGLGNVYSGNSYCWQGGGPGGWSFEAGLQGNQVTRAQWQGQPDGQDAASTFEASGCSGTPVPTPPPPSHHLLAAPCLAAPCLAVPRLPTTRRARSARGHGGERQVAVLESHCQREEHRPPGRHQRRREQQPGAVRELRRSEDDKAGQGQRQPPACRIQSGVRPRQPAVRHASGEGHPVRHRERDHRRVGVV